MSSQEDIYAFAAWYQLEVSKRDNEGFINNNIAELLFWPFWPIIGPIASSTGKAIREHFAGAKHNAVLTNAVKDHFYLHGDVILSRYHRPLRVDGNDRWRVININASMVRVLSLCGRFLGVKIGDSPYAALCQEGDDSLVWMVQRDSRGWITLRNVTTGLFLVHLPPKEGLHGIHRAEVRREDLPESSTLVPGTIGDDWIVSVQREVAPDEVMSTFVLIKSSNVIVPYTVAMTRDVMIP